MASVCLTFFKIYFNWRLINLQYCSGFCHTLTWISHECTCVPHPELLSRLPPHPIPLGHPIAPALRTLSQASNLDWQSVSHVIIYMFRCCSLETSHPRLLPQSLRDCSIHLCLFFITRFLWVKKDSSAWVGKVLLKGPENVLGCQGSIFIAGK